MSKAIKSLLEAASTAETFAKKVVKTLTPGSRIFPVNKKDDAKTQLRIDAGEKIGDQQNVVLQVNSQATNSALKGFVSKQKQGTHAKLATESFNTKAEDVEGEVSRVLSSLRDQALKKVG